MIIIFESELQENINDTILKKYKNLIKKLSIDNRVLCICKDNENGEYYLEECCLEVYVGKLNKIIDVKGTENKLFWSTLDNNFFDETQYAGEGNIGHIVQHIETLKGELLQF